MDHLGQLLQQRMEEHKLGPAAKAATICHAVNSLSDGSYTATRYKNGLLTLTVASSAQAADLQARLHTLRERFSERVAPNPITRIYIRQNGA